MSLLRKILFTTLVFYTNAAEPRGCFATWFTETYRDWKGKFKGVSIVCDEHDRKWYNTPDATWLFERTEGKESNAAYNGTVKITNIGAKATLETWESSNVKWVGLAGYGANPSEDMWSVVADPKNKSHVQLHLQGWYLHQRPYGNFRAYVSLEYNKPERYPYSFVAAIKLEGSMYDFKFTIPNKTVLAAHTRQVGLRDLHIFTNPGKSNISRTFEVHEKVADEFSWSFTGGLNYFIKLKGKGGIPKIASSEFDIAFEIGASLTRRKKEATEKSFKMSYEVRVPPNSSVEVSAWYQRTEGITMPFSAETEITGRTTRVSNYDDLIQDTPATGEMILAHLKYSNFEGKIIRVKKFSVITRATGKLTASIGYDGQISVDGRKVVDQKQ